jgi:hypothetical protein
MAEPNLDCARTVYRRIRDCWIAGGSALEAHERLSVITVAAGVREFAFLTQIDGDFKPTVAQLLIAAGLSAHSCFSPFDVDIEPEGISVACTEAYSRVQREMSPLNGLGVWVKPAALSGCVGMMTLGRALGYPQCCEMMDLRTKQRDHELFLAAIVEEEGDDPERVERALRERREYSKASYDHCHGWNDRFVLTHSRFPFVLHTACDDCLRVDQSPTAILNRKYEDLVLSVSEELHLMVRWGAQALTYRSENS